jgi:3-methyladenine DNA glycosylase AlkD
MTSPVEFIRKRFRTLANPANAKAMAAYMKTSMPFYGIKKPDRVPVLREMDKRFPIDNRAQYVETIESLWSQPRREEKYAALHVAIKHKQYITPVNLPLYRRLIIDGAWWDFVDEISIRLVGHLTLQWPDTIGAKMNDWVEDRNMWIRRSALISHIKHKERTNHQQLFEHCLKCAGEKEFFIRKAIGWTLRQYAYASPKRVSRFLRKHRPVLSTLTFREAAKHLDLDVHD